ncbi:MAG: hypothetical protein ACLFQV_11640 [Vulcanimicrobiota bacterium]
MNKKICWIFLFLFFSTAVTAFAGDTGTYEILEYRVKLIPRSDGTVKMEYYQKWKVLTGHIPWITVGMANNHYDIVGRGKDIAEISKVNDSGWTGVRIDLNRDYQPGQTFEIEYTVDQRRLFQSSEDSYVLNFTPGWYNRASINHLELRMKTFAKLDTVKAEPKPTIVYKESDELVWKRENMAPAQTYTISISIPRKSVPTPMPAANLKAGRRGGGEEISEAYAAWGCFALFLLTPLFIILSLVFVRKRYGYTGGNIFVAGVPTSSPDHSAGFFGGGGGGISTGGGGGFGGRSYSCACACVSCACACACAGGGGAACSRKLEHSCPICNPIIEKNERNNNVEEES